MAYLLGIVLFACGALVLLRITRGSAEAARAEAAKKIESGDPITPSSRVQRALVSKESLLWEGHRHPFCLWQWLTGLVLLQPVMIFIGSTTHEYVGTFLTWLAGMVAFGFRMWMWDRDRLCVTTHRILEVSGLISYHVDVMPVSKLTDAKLITPAQSQILCWLRVIGITFGTIVVESAGQDQALSKIEYVPAAEHVYKVIMSLSTQPAS